MDSTDMSALYAASVEGVVVTRYLSVAGLIVLLYDHCLTFEQERQLIWPTRATVVKWALLSNRYIVEVMLIVTAHALSGINSWGLSDNFCKALWMTVCCVAIISIAISHAVIMLKLWKLWDARRTIMILTMVTFVLIETATIVAVGFTAREVLPNALFSSELNSCTLAMTPPTLKFAWACIVVFDLFSLSMVVFNALSRPRGGNFVLLKALSRDGIGFFFAISALGWLNLVVSFRAPASESELGLFCVWALSVTLVTRMMMNLREAELRRQERTLLCE